MRANREFEIVNIAGEYLMVPTGRKADSFNGIIALSDEAAFLLRNMNTTKSENDCIQLLLDEYDVDDVTARSDLNEFLKLALDIGIVEL